jgi:hypothetical protein
VQGADAFEAKDYATALDRFNRASALFPAPSIAVMRARTLVKLGRWVEALDAYAAVSSLTVPAAAPEAYRRAQSDALTEAGELRTSMPRLQIQSPKGAGQSEKFVIRLDERVLPAAVLDVEQPVDPGTHTVRADIDGSVVFQQTVTVAAGERTSVDVAPGSDDGSAPTKNNEAFAASSQPGSARRVWTYVAFGAGALGFGVAIVSGSAAISKQSDLDAACRPRCPPGSEDDRASIRSNRSLAFAGLAVGVVGVGVGVYLLLSGRSDSSHVAARFTPAGARLEGVF